MHEMPLHLFDTRRSSAARLSFLLFAAICAAPSSGCTDETCSVRDNGDGTQTLACGGDEVVIGGAGGGCTATDNGDGTQTIACADGTEVTLSDGVSCGLTAPGDGTVTFSCSDGSEWTFAPGCESRVMDFWTHRVLVADCPDGSTVPLTWKWNDAPKTQLSAGGYRHSCGLRADGSPHCWGSYSGGATAEQPPGEVFVQITAGVDHACGLRVDGTSRCWGVGNKGQMADQPGETFVQLVAGGFHTCGLRPDGSSRCWGDNGYGQIADQPGERFVQLATGLEHTCGLRVDGTSRCWGSGPGQIADQPGEIFVQLVAGGDHTCGLRADGSSDCWGIGQDGQTADQPGNTFVQLTAGFAHNCGLRGDGTAHCWGAVDAPPAHEVFVQLASGGNHSCGLRADGTALCWGENTQGQTDPSWHFGCRAADAPAGIVAGLSYERWDFVTTGLPYFGSLGAPGSTGTMTNVGLPSTGDGFALRITGYVNVPAAGVYTFALTSDDGSRLSIGSDVIVDNDDVHLAATETEYLCLEAGWHPITVEYFENTGAETLSLAMGAGDAAPAPIADADLGYVP